MHEQLGRLHRPCGFAIAQAIKDAGTSLHDELAEHEAGTDARELTDGFHSSLPGFDLPFGRARARQSSTPAIQTIRFARRRDIGVIRTTPKKRLLAAARTT